MERLNSAKTSESFTLFTTESLLTTQVGFNVYNASPVQRARCRIGDGLPLGDLKERPDVIALCGGQEAIDSLPSERGIAAKHFVDVSAIRTCKTMMAVARAIRATQCVDLANLKTGEIASLSIISLTEDKALVTFGLARRLMEGLPELRKFLAGEPKADEMTIRHPSGKSVIVRCTVLSKTGGSMVSDWCAGLIADEAPRMIGRGDGVANLDDTLSAVRGRVLQGAQIQLLGSPWAPMGPVYDMVQEHFGKPTESFVVLRSTGPQNWPEFFTPEYCERLQHEDPTAYTTDVEGEFADPETGWLDPRIVREHTRRESEDVPSIVGRKYFAALDTSGGQAGANPHSLVVVEIKRDTDEPTFDIVYAREWRGMSIEDIWAAVADSIRHYRIDRLWIDQWAGPQNVALAKNAGVKTVSISWVSGDSTSDTSLSKVEAFTDVATMIHSGRVTIHSHKLLQRDLLSVVKRPRQNGNYEIVLPHTRDGRHCDFAAAVVMAIAKAAKAQPVDVDGLRRLQELVPRRRM